MARYSFATTQGTGPNIELCWLDPWDPSFYYIAANRVQLTTNYAIGSSCSQDFLAWIWPSPMHIGPPVYMWRTLCETLAEYAVQQTVITNSQRSKWCGEKNRRAHHVDLPGHVCYTTPWPKFYSWSSSHKAFEIYAYRLPESRVFDGNAMLFIIEKPYISVASRDARANKEETKLTYCATGASAIEVGDRWSEEAAAFIHILAQAQSRHPPTILQQSVAASLAQACQPLWPMQHDTVRSCLSWKSHAQFWPWCEGRPTNWSWLLAERGSGLIQWHPVAIFFRPSFSIAWKCTTGINSF